MAIKLQPEELKKLIDLTKEAETTPVIAMSMRDGMEGRDLATLAWDRVRDYWRELGAKYGFDSQNVRGISAETGEVILT